MAADSCAFLLSVFCTVLLFPYFFKGKKKEIKFIAYFMACIKKKKNPFTSFQPVVTDYNLQQ